MKEKEQEFWVTNISKKRVTLSDLRVTVPPKKTVNFLSKHYHFTYEQLKESLKSGSLKAKSDKLKISTGPRAPAPPTPIEISKRPILIKKRTSIEITEPVYDDFILTEDQFATEAANFEFEDE